MTKTTTIRGDLGPDQYCDQGSQPDYSCQDNNRVESANERRDE